MAFWGMTGLRACGKFEKAWQLGLLLTKGERSLIFQR